MPVQNEIQTITVPNFVGATGYPYFSVTWPNYQGAGVGYGAGTDSLEGLTASQAANNLETNFNVALPGPISGKTISVTGSLDGTTLILTVEFDGPDIATTNVDSGSVEDWGDLGVPVITVIQEGGDTPSPPSSVTNFGSSGGFGSLSHGNGFN